jgi:hypothetical protein
MEWTAQSGVEFQDLLYRRAVGSRLCSSFLFFMEESRFFSYGSFILNI